MTHTRKSLQRKTNDELIDIILELQSNVTIETAYEMDTRFGIPFPKSIHQRIGKKDDKKLIE